MVQHKNHTQPSHNELATSNFASSSGIQWNLVNKDTTGTCQSVHFKQIIFRENIWDFSVLGQMKLSIIYGCPC